MFESHAISVAVDENIASGGLELIGTEVVRFRFRRKEVLDEIRKFVGRRLAFCIRLHRASLEVFRREFRYRIDRFTPPSRRIMDEMTTTFRTLSGWRIAHCIATPPPML